MTNLPARPIATALPLARFTLRTHSACARARVESFTDTTLVIHSCTAWRRDEAPGSPSSQSLLVIEGVDLLTGTLRLTHFDRHSLARFDLLLDCCRDKNHAKNRNRYRLLLRHLSSPHLTAPSSSVCTFMTPNERQTDRPTDRSLPRSLALSCNTVRGEEECQQAHHHIHV